jgi:hypothetical protein
MRIANIAPFYELIVGGVKQAVENVVEYTASRAPGSIKSLRYDYDSRYRKGRM